MEQWTAREMQWVATDSAQWLPYSLVTKAFKSIAVSMQSVFSSALKPVFGKYYN